jgi:hypothetical protein
MVLWGGAAGRAGIDERRVGVGRQHRTHRDCGRSARASWWKYFTNNWNHRSGYELGSAMAPLGQAGMQARHP